MPVLYGQKISGLVIDGTSGKPLPLVRVTVSGTSLEETTDVDGTFIISESPPIGEFILTLTKNAFFDKHFPVKALTGDIDLGVIIMQPDLPEAHLQTGIISLEDHELDEEESGHSNVSGLLQASRDVFLTAAAFDFSPAFFRPRGYDSEYSTVLINGVEMNKFLNGRPLWSNWGGLNDVQRNQEFWAGTGASEVSFGGPAGTTNIVMRASQYSNGGKFSYAIANRAYTGRAMGSYHSGLLPSGWAYSFSLSRRFATESYMEGSSYNANSFFTSVEKKLNDAHSLNLTAFYTPNTRGKNSPNTQEVYDLKGQKYNSYWGRDGGEIRNSRLRHVEEPVVMLNHFWSPKSDFSINSSVAYQFGQIGNSRIDYGGSRLYAVGSEALFIGGGSNPDPAYYQKMPSYFFRFEHKPDYQSAYLAEQDFRKNGQLNWSEFYLANESSATAGGNAIYALYEDRTDDRQITTNSNFRYRWNPLVVLTGAVAHRQLKSENFANIVDLFGAVHFLDVDSFAEGPAAQNDLDNPNRLAGENDIFKYHYSLKAGKTSGFLQTEFNWNRIEAYLAAEGAATAYQRTGHFRNGNFPDNSLGEGRLLRFGTYAAKSGITYKINGRHYLTTNLAHLTKPPALRNSYSNARQNNDVVTGLKNEKITTADAGYIIRAPYLTGRITGFYGLFRDATEVSFYYADGLADSETNVTNAFVQEVMTGIGKSNLGLEFGLEVPLNSTLRLRTAGSLGNYIYDRNPQLYLTSDDFPEVRKYGDVFLKGYRLPGGPQRAIQAAFEYRDPSYWWISTSANFFSGAYIDISPLSRTRNFYTDIDGLPIYNYDENIAEELLRQEQFDNYMLMNMVGGKSWRLKNRFVGIFGSLNNILNSSYKTGGYEQSRNVNYTLLKADMERKQPIFAPKYWFGYGTTYYAHVYYRF